MLFCYDMATYVANNNAFYSSQLSLDDLSSEYAVNTHSLNQHTFASPGAPKRNIS